ncbi:hypothetical protein D9757_006836 [Collybiopsis confluens]|uniref:Uncharacterized protein n=1 Tax=Collybiopsis confluens TaxID=2823264 RepID=A0A8H5HQ84_9AGAR|nr:hypothetical protein D9757_006836 [Collybiopsis confluens]
MGSILGSSTNENEMDSGRFPNSPTTRPPSELNASLPHSVVDGSLSPEPLEYSSEREILEDLPELSPIERRVIAWMRAHPGEPFRVDESCEISALGSGEHSNSVANSRTSLVSHSRPSDDYYERIDLSDEPNNRERRSTYSNHRHRNVISPGAFSAVGGNQRVISRQSADHFPAQTTQTGARHSFRHGRRNLGSPRSSYGTRSSANEGTTTVMGASVLQGASNFVINGAMVAPGAFSAIAGDQEIWVD